ncbi:16S rRNA (guanine(527)-N(7))-methyltransferase RsmG [Kaarinaea lacus]
MSVEKTLYQGLEALAIPGPEEIKRQLLAFIELLHKWNRVYNLTAIRDKEKMVTHHILDSVAVMPFLHGVHILDVGSGAGLPGVPLAMVSPERQFVLLDSNAKKTRFLQQVKAELGLTNLTIETGRIEHFHFDKAFDTVLSRAFSSISQFLLAAGTHCKADGVIIAMKGEYPESELQSIPDGYSIKAVLPVDVPFLSAQRHIVKIVPH